jgi:uncharacterized protein
MKTNQPAMERKAFRVQEWKEVADQPGTFEGYLSVFGNVDHGGDMVEKGAFKRTISHRKQAGKKFVLLWQHDTKQPIGVFTAEEDNIGLKIRAELTLGVQQANEAHLLLKSGALDGLSIGYGTVKSAYDPKTGVRTLKELALWEGSLVTFGMNDQALVTGVKAADFNATLQQEELQRMRWRMMDAISETIHEAMDDEMTAPDARLALIDASLTQFHAAMLNWATQAIAAGIKSADLITETKTTATPTDATGTAPEQSDPALDAEGGPGQKSDDPPGEDPDVQALISEIKASASVARAAQLIAELKAM